MATAQETALPSSSSSSSSSSSARVGAHRQLSTFESGVIGGISGTIEVLIQQPTVAWKNALQQSRPLPLKPNEMYRGVGINAGSIAPITAVQFAVNNAFGKWLLSQKKDSKELSSVEKMGVATIAGAASALVSTPAEFIMIQQQKTGSSLLHTYSTIMKSPASSSLSRGVFKMYKGLIPTAIRESLFTCGYLGLGPILKEVLVVSSPELFEHRQMTAALLGSICAGLIAATLTQPADTVKTRLQGDIGLEGELKYRSPLQAASLIYQKDGAKAFFSGLLPRAGRMIGAVFILGRCNEYLTSYALSRH